MLTKYKTLILLIILLVPVLFLIQYKSLSPVLNYGFSPDDWGLLLFYKTLGSDPLSKIPYVWSVKGAYTTSQVYFIGILNDFFGLDYSAYQITNIILKTLATLSLYPLILVIFKRRSLAFLTTILYGTSYMGSRSLEYVVKGTDYLAIIPMNFFFIVYFYIIQKKLKGFRWFVLMGIFWFIALMISPIRIYPILVLVPLIEIYLWIRNRSINNIINSLKRLLILYLPFLLIYLYKPSSTLMFLQNPSYIYQMILRGNWHLLLTPFQGVGLTIFFVENEWNRIFGWLNLAGLRSFLSFLLGVPIAIFGSITLVLSILKSRKPVKFFYRTIFATLILNIIFYYVAIHELNIAEDLRLHFDPARMYPVVISGFMLALSLACFLEWRGSGKKDSLLFALWISPPIILLYTFLIWLFAPFGVGFEGQQGYYLVVPTQATSLFSAAILISIYDRATKAGKFLQVILFLTLLVLIFFIYSMNNSNTSHYFNSAGIDGRYAFGQEALYNQVLRYIADNFNNNEPVLFYFDVPRDAGVSSYYYEESLFNNLPTRLLLRNGIIHEGCIGTIFSGIGNLTKIIAVKENEKGFIYWGQCIKNNTGGNTGGVFYKPDNFYAYKIKNGELIDIKQEVLNQLGLKY